VLTLLVLRLGRREEERVSRSVEALIAELLVVFTGSLALLLLLLVVLFTGMTKSKSDTDAARGVFGF
jgi:hypothetical protein